MHVLRMYIHVGPPEAKMHVGSTLSHLHAGLRRRVRVFVLFELHVMLLSGGKHQLQAYSTCTCTHTSTAQASYLTLPEL